MAEAHDPYLDPGTGILTNKVGASTWEQLQAAETDLVTLRALQLAARPITGRFDLAHLQAIHRYLFADVYPWAGQLRTVDMAKTGDTVSFFPAARLAAGAAHTFDALAADNLLSGLDRDRFVTRLAHHLDQINHLHPFREGNGRTQRIFCSQLAARAGYHLDWTRIDPAENNTASRTGEDALRALLERITRAG